MKGFSIIIVNWNGLKHLKRFLGSVTETNYENFEIILADNASTDESINWVKSTYPEIKIAVFEDNFGYTGGNNRAVPFAEKEILIFLNNDVNVDPNWLQGISKLFELDNALAVVQPKILSYQSPDYFEYAGAAGGFLDVLGYPYCRGRIMDTVEKDEGQYDTSIDITWASGAALAIKKDIFEQHGGFDEDFQFHMEEIDLCWRVLNSGYRISYTSESIVYHLGGGTLSMESPRKVYYNFRNSLYLLTKNLPSSTIWYKIPLRIILDIVAAWRSLLSGRPAEFVAIAKAHLHFYQRLIKLYKKREHRIENPNSNILSSVLIIWAYFILRKKFYNKI